MTISAIIFDLDGTLANTLPLCIQSFQNTIEHFTGRRPDSAEIWAEFGVSEEGILERLIPGHLDQTLPYFLAEYERLHDLCPQTFPGVDRIFSSMQAKALKKAIVTGKGSQSAEISLRRLGLDRWIDLVEVGFPDRNDKPFSIQKVLEQWALPAKEVAYLGDTRYDMRASKEAGLLPLGAAWAETSELRNGNHSGAAATFSSIDKFIDWVEGL